MNYYNKIAPGYKELYGEEQKKKARLIASILRPKPNEKLLDVGCGDGGCLEIFGCKSVGIDPASDLISRYMGDCQVFEGKAESLPFKDAEFDIVVSITAVHNFDDIEKGLLEMRRVGKEKFAFSILKKSPRAKRIHHFINDLFSIVEIIDEEKDFIYVCTVQK